MVPSGSLLPSPAKQHPFGPRQSSISPLRIQSTAKPAVLRSNRRQPEFVRPWTYGNHKNVNKSKGPDKCPGLSASWMARATRGRNVDGLLVLFGLLFRRRQAFEALQKLLLGHALNRDLGVVGIDAGACRPDQRHGIRLRFVDFDEFLQ